MSVEKQRNRAWIARGWIMAPALLALYLVATMLRGGGTMYWGPLESDMTNQFYPWRVFIHRWIMRGVMPFWDPHVFSGYPTIETQQMLALNPVHLLTIWLPPNIGLIAAMGAHTLIASLGMAWALRKWGRCTPLASAAGAGVFTFGALFAVRVMAGHFTVVAALAWWPLAALSVMRLTRLVPGKTLGKAPSNSHSTRPLILQHALRALLHLRTLLSAPILRLMALSAIFHAMVCLAGGPQYIVYLFYIDIAIIIAVARRGAFITALAACAGAWILALLASAPQWLPALWYLPHTGRALTSSGSTGWTTQPLLNIAYETLLPFPFGNDLTSAHLHFKNVWETALYPGALALALSFAVLMRSLLWLCLRLLRRKRDRMLVTPLTLAGTCIFIIGLYMTLGGWLPGFSGFREPTKARALLAFAFALTSAAGITSLARFRPSAILSVAFALIITGSLAALAIARVDQEQFKALVQSFGKPFDPLAHADYFAFLNDPAPAYNAYRRACIQVIVLTGIALLALIACRRRGQASSFAFTIIGLLTIADPLATHAPAWAARYPWSRIGLPQPIADYFAPRLAQVSQNNELPWRVILNSGIINRTHHMEGLYEFHGYDPLMPAFAVGRMLVKGAAEISEKERPHMRTLLMQRAGVRYDAGETRLVDFSTTAVLQAPAAALFTVSRKVQAGSPGPNLFGPSLTGVSYILPPELAGNILEPPTPSPQFQSMVSRQFPPGGDSQLAPGESLDPIDTGRPDEWGVRVKLNRPGLVTYKGTWLPGWHVVVDGKDTGAALLANNWMCAAIVPVGQHEMLFKYRPVAWHWSLAIALGGLISIMTVYGAGAALQWRTRRKLKSPSD